MNDLSKIRIPGCYKYGGNSYNAGMDLKNFLHYKGISVKSECYYTGDPEGHVIIIGKNGERVHNAFDLIRKKLVIYLTKKILLMQRWSVY